jgi:aminomethyltransferase
MSAALASLPLDAEHRALGARMVPFAGYAMPLHYPAGILAEHRAVRENVGLFDVSHMGEFEVRGPDATAFLQYVTSNDVTRLQPGQAQYSLLLTEAGTIVDDLLVYRLEEAPPAYLLVVNAANRAKDWAWLERWADDVDVDLVDRSEAIALLALQGPRAEATLAPVVDPEVRALPYYHSVLGTVAGVPARISRTGYTGEDGFELFLDAADATHVWRALLAAGAQPAGLGARDTLRLEMGYPLYGQDLDEEHTALEANLGWVVKFQKGDFLGRLALLGQKEAGVGRLLTGLRLQGPGVPRHGYTVLDGNGEPVGAVTSGTHSPSLGVGIALAYLDADVAAEGTSLAVEIRERPVPAVVTRPPFYRHGSVRVGTTKRS